MHRLSAPNPADPAPVKILFYGQSIIGQSWYRQVEAELRRRFDRAQLVVENRAVGGFMAPQLSRVMVHDLPASDPDLIVFHVYGGDNDGTLESLVRYMRQRTAAEVLVLSSHVDNQGKNPKRRMVMRQARDRHAEQLRRLAVKYQCGFLDVRSRWKAYLGQQQCSPAALVKPDGIHLNDTGQALMARLVIDGLQVQPRPTTRPDAARIRFMPWDGLSPIRWTGYRVDIVGKSDRGAAARVLIDGQSPASYAGVYLHTRPGSVFGHPRPGIRRVSHEKPLVAEQWQLCVTDRPQDGVYHFRVMGSVTGDDGAGSSDRRFVSKSGRVVIEPQDLMLTATARMRSESVQPGLTVGWQTICRGVDVYRPAGSYSALTVANGLTDTEHTLALEPIDGRLPQVRGIRVYHAAGSAP